MDTICINKTQLLLLILVIVIVTMYNYYMATKHVFSKPPVTQLPFQQPQLTPVIKPESPDNIIVNIDNNRPGHHLRNPLKDYDQRALHDPLMPPFKRDENNMMPELVYPSLYSLPTRGYSTSFKRMGYLTNTEAENSDKYKFLILMGRQKYRNSSQFEYYVVSSSKESNIKFDLERQKKELNTDDVIKVPQLGDMDYTVTIDRNLGFDYVPFV